jgi:tetratricopeptide (TPR) repeat protein
MSRLLIAMLVAFTLALAACASRPVVRKELQQAREASAAGHYGQAVTDWGRAIKSGKLNKQELFAAYNNRAYAYYTLGRYQEALKDYGQALRLNPNNA